jgi:hypothetical protein
MALAATHACQSFFDKDSLDQAKHKATEVFKSVVTAPWMSSGLTDNNAFTTTLVLRTYGYLIAEGLVDPGTTFSRPWENHLAVSDFKALVRSLREKNPTSEFLWLSLSDITRDKIVESVTTESEIGEDLERRISLDLRRIVESGWILAKDRFEKAGPELQQQFKEEPTGYSLVAANRRLLSAQYAGSIREPEHLDLPAIARAISSSTSNFAINSYSPSAAVLYWFVDGISRARIELPEKSWTELCEWASRVFHQQRSLVVSHHQAMMDPVSMGMAACLCARLRYLCDAPEKGMSNKHRSVLPSEVELDQAIRELVAEQTEGIWPKYFPMFHYQDAGSNFCFSFELLEALLIEFGREPNYRRGSSMSTKPGSRLMEEPVFIEALENSVTWCERNRWESGKYSGWNSGGQAESLQNGHPESWATAVVHMFLAELTRVLSHRIEDGILRKYSARDAQDVSSGTAIGQMLDIDVVFQNDPYSLKDVLHSKIVVPHSDCTFESLRQSPSKGHRSALLFGPPGTSKTKVTQAVADDLRWPMISLSPADFVKGSLAHVYEQAQEIFEDLMDLSRVIVFFDEMDALVQTREDGHLDMASQFLTTMMLPKLADLHERGRVVFFMATNFQDRFDAAIKRAGRFDLLLCMGPPKLEEKLSRLSLFLGKRVDTAQAKEAEALMRKHIGANRDWSDRLELFTFGDFQSFLRTLGTGAEIVTKLKELTTDQFGERLIRHSKYVGLRVEDFRSLKDKPRTLEEAYRLDHLSLKGEEITPMLRYLCDRKESKDQL